MDISQLKTIIHVAELGSLSKAADRLNIAQPALSRQVRLLEYELGTQLFTRHGRGMVITESGQKVLEHAVRIMAELDAIRTDVAGEGTGHRGVVALGMPPTVAEIVTVPLVRKVGEAYPELSLRLASAFSGHLVDWLHRGVIDVAVSYEPELLHSLRVVPVLSEDLLLVGPAGQGLSLETPVDFSELARRRLVLPSPAHGLRMLVEDIARREEVQLTTAVEADSFGAMINLVQSGIGMTILPLAPIYDKVRAGELCAAPIASPTPTRRIVIAHSADRPLSPAARFVGEAFVEIVEELIRRGAWIGSINAEAKVA